MSSRRPSSFSTRSHTASSVRLLFKRVLNLLADVAVVLLQRLPLVLGEDPERHAHEGVREFHVEPVLTVLDAAGNLEIQPPEAAALVAQFDLVVRHRAALG